MYSLRFSCIYDNEFALPFAFEYVEMLIGNVESRTTAKKNHRLNDVCARQLHILKGRFFNGNPLECLCAASKMIKMNGLIHSGDEIELTSFVGIWREAIVG